MLTKDILEEGFHLCEQNAYQTLLEAWELFQNKYFRHSIFFSLLVMEEVGKGYYLFDNYNLGNTLTEEDLKNEKVFFHHLNKMYKARQEHEEQVIVEISEEFPGICAGGIIGFSKSDFDEFWCLRNEILFVGYNFNQKKWRYPQQIEYTEDLSYSVVEKATSLFISFEVLLNSLGHDTFIILSKCARI